MEALCRDASAASRLLAAAPAETRDRALTGIAAGLRERSAEVLEANLADLADERAEGLTPALRDRLSLDEARIEAMAVATTSPNRGEQGATSSSTIRPASHPSSRIACHARR